MNTKNIAIAGAATVFAGACTVAILKHHVAETNEDLEEMKQILNDVNGATNIEEVQAYMHCANEIFAHHNSVKEFYDLDVEIMDRGTEKACEFLEECKKEKEA